MMGKNGDVAARGSPLMLFVFIFPLATLRKM